MKRRADAPANVPSRKGVDGECNTDEARSGGDEGEIARMQHVRSGHAELTIHLVVHTRFRSVQDCRSVRLSPVYALNTKDLHRRRDSASGDSETFAAKLPPDLPDTMNRPVFCKDSMVPGAQRVVAVREDDTFDDLDLRSNSAIERSADAFQRVSFA